MSRPLRAWCMVCHDFFWHPFGHTAAECEAAVHARNVPRLVFPEGELPEWREPDVDWADANADADYRAAEEQP